MSSIAVFVENAEGYLKCELPNINLTLVNNITWFRNGSLLNLDVDGFSVSNKNQILYFKNITLSQSGNYFCLVELTNDQKVESARYNLTVNQGNYLF